MLKIIYHESCLTPYFTSVAESPLRMRAIYNRLKDRYRIITPMPAVPEDILRVHTFEHLQRVQQEGPEIYETALMAAGGALFAARFAAKREPAFAVVRPPGHHASRSRYGGFCFFNNIAVAVASLLDAEIIENVIIVDTDMHDGDGTRDIFCNTDSVSIIDIRMRERLGYMDLLRDRLIEAPDTDLLAVSAGFDLYVRDWGGLLHTTDFHEIGYLLYETAMEKAKGQYFAVLEGGYFLEELGKNVLSFCLGLEGQKPRS